MDKTFQKTFPVLKNTGFTLIELLVVVLIIGILAAVAVPQYEMAVAKSRVAQVLPFMASVKKAQEVYYAANGEYSNEWDELDVTIPQGLAVTPCISGGKDTECVRFPFGTQCRLLSSGGSVYCGGGVSSLPSIAISYDRGTNMKNFGLRLCAATKGEKGEKICRSLGGVEKRESDGYVYYSF